MLQRDGPGQSKPLYFPDLGGGAGVDGAACFLAGAAASSGQSGSALPGSQSLAVVRPPRASALVTDETSAKRTSAAAILRITLSIVTIYSGR
jgi:hypothetical protein